MILEQQPEQQEGERQEQGHEQQEHEQEHPEQAEPQPGDVPPGYVPPDNMDDDEYCDYLRFVLSELHEMQRLTQGFDVGVQRTVRKALITFIEGELEVTQMFSALFDEFNLLIQYLHP